MGDLTGIDPPRMDWSSSDLPTAFTSFKQYCELIFSGPLAGKSEEEKVTYVLLWVGQEGLRVYNTWDMAPADRKKLGVLWDCFKKFLEPKTNYRLSRFHLQKYRQSAGESVDEYMMRCKLQAKKCNFRDVVETDERLVEQLIIGIRHSKMQEKLLGRDATLTLDGALDIVRTFEATVTDMQLFSGETSIHPVQHDRHPNKRQQREYSGSRRTCKYCGGTHPAGINSCPAYGSKCVACGRLNHWKVMCRAAEWGRERAESRGRGRPAPRGHVDHSRQRSKSRHKSPSRGTDRSATVHNVEREACLEQGFEKLVFDNVDAENDTRSEVYASLDIQLGVKHATLKVKVDTGAQGNVLPLRMYRRMYPENLGAGGYPSRRGLQESTTVLMAYNGERIKQYGTLMLPCKHNEVSHDTEFYVADTPGPAIVGLPSCRALQLITMHCEITRDEPIDMPIKTKEDLLQCYPDRFEGIGNFQGKFHITTDPNVAPVVHAPRKCPIHMRDEIKSELDAMVKMKVITRVTEPTDWVSSIVYSRKSSGKLRICLDPKDLNEAVKRPHYKTPTLDEVTYKLAGAKVFSKLDARHGYWSISLDDESSRKTTFNSPFGRFRFERLPFGLNLSQDVFQERMDNILEQCPGTMGMADDVAVFGRDDVEHDRNLHNVMKVARKHGLVFNVDKCDIHQPSIHFFGLVFDVTGVRPDPSKVNAIKRLETPRDTTQLQEFLGVATYMSPFIPHLSHHTATLRDLLKKDVEFAWSPSHEDAFQKTKQLICEEVTLSHFDPKMDTVVQVDASSRGLGAVLMQGGPPDRIRIEVID